MKKLAAIRPYQLMCLFCKSGEGMESIKRDRKLRRLLDKIAEDPDRPLTLVCNVSGNYSYQNPGDGG